MSKRLADTEAADACQAYWRWHAAVSDAMFKSTVDALMDNLVAAKPLYMSRPKGLTKPPRARNSAAAPAALGL